MATITNGTIEYSHVVKVEDFGVNKKAGTSLSFTTTEGEDVTEAIEHVTKLVKANVAKMLGKAITVAPATVSTETKTDKERLAEAAGVSQSQQQAATPAKPPRAAGPRKAAETKTPEPPKPTAASAAASVVEEDEDFSATPATTVKEVPDADLAAAMTKKNAEIKNSQAIRELVGSYAPEGHTGAFHAHDIPQAERSGFLDKLGKLKPKA